MGMVTRRTDSKTFDMLIKAAKRAAARPYRRDGFRSSASITAATVPAGSGALALNSTAVRPLLGHSKLTL